MGGLYSDGGTEEGIPIEVALSGQMLALRPELTWKYIYQIESACRGARANRAHEIIAELEARLPRVWVLTQNVDGFHGDAGSDNLIEIHGNIHDLQCTQCTWDGSVPDYAELGALPPRCARCGGLVRPKVVLFGEMLPQRPLGLLNRELARGFDMVVSVGTTSGFPYIAQPVLAAAAGKPTVEINPGDTEVSELVAYRVRAGARVAWVWTEIQTLRTRAALLIPEWKPVRQLARRSARIISRAAMPPYSEGIAALLRAGIHSRDGHPDKALGELRLAIDHLQGASARHLVAACRVRLGKLTGDQPLIERGETELGACGARNIERMLNLLAPGFSP